MKCKTGLRRPLLIALCASLLACASVTPATPAHMSVAKLTHVSRLILRARCLENSTAWDAGEIWTFTTYEPTEVWKGSAPPRVSVRLLGGRIGNLTSNVSGVPRFHAGEDVVLFLTPTTLGDFSVVSWVQGTFRHSQSFFARIALASGCRAAPGSGSAKMKRAIACLTIALFSAAMIFTPAVQAYSFVSTVPQSGGCPQPNSWNLSVSSPLDRQWSTSLPSLISPVILTVAAAGTSAQLDEIEQAISDSFSVWAGVTGTTFNAITFPGLEAPLARVTNANSCTNDAESNVDGLNTICFNQSSDAFTPGVLAFTRTFTANAPGASVGTSGPAAFAGKILDADTLLCNTGEVTFATPAALATSPGAYDLESLLTHELGHWMGLDQDR